MKRGLVIGGILVGLTLSGGAFWWFRTGRFYYFIPKLKITGINENKKMIRGMFGNKPFTYSAIGQKTSSGKRLAPQSMIVPAQRGFHLEIRSTGSMVFPSNLGFSIKKKGKLVETPQPFLGK